MPIANPATPFYAVVGAGDALVERVRATDPSQLKDLKAPKLKAPQVKAPQLDVKEIPAQLKALPAGYAAPAPAAGSKRKLTKSEEEERERKKKKNEKKVETRVQKAKEQNEKQATWQKFAKKSEKKGIHIAGVSGTSIFKTPENPLGRGACRACVDSCALTSGLQSGSPAVARA